MAKKLYVGNLNFDLSDQEFEQAFSKYGQIVSAVIIKDHETGRSKGFGFVEFTDEAGAQRAKTAMNDTPLMGRPLKVDDARDRRTRSNYRDRYGSNTYGGGRNW